MVAMEILRAAGAEPLEPYPGVLKPWRSRCNRCQREVSPKLTSIKQGGGACRFCGSRRLQDANAEAVMRRAGLVPLEPYPGSKSLWLCECRKCGSRFSTRYERVRRNRPCKVCTQAEIARQAELVMMNAGVMPLTAYPGSHVPWSCRCLTCGKEVTPQHTTVKQGQGACRYCSKKAIDPDDAVRVMERAGLEPIADFPGVGRPWRCRCRRCKNEVSPCLTSIRAGQGCRYCAGQVVNLDSAAMLMRGAGVEPLVPYPGARTPWLSRCTECGRTVTPRYNAVQQGQGPCRYCAHAGFNIGKPGVVYVIHHLTKGGGTVKIGVTNSRTNRLALFVQHGWSVVLKLPFDSGEIAYSIEQRVLHWLRATRHLHPNLRDADMDGMNGATETFSDKEVSLREITERVRAISSQLADADQPPTSVVA